MSFESRISAITGLGFSEASLPKLKAYIDLLWASNEELNLISRKMTFEELLDNHVIDCLLPLAMFPEGVKSVADFGSGGGLPAIIYAIQFPGVRFHLYEKSVLKREFLEKCRRITPNIEIHGEIPLDLGSVELVMARGFKPLDVILDMSRKFYERKGRYFLLKGRREKIDDEIQLARKKFKDLEVRVEKLVSPVLDVERHLVVV